MASKTGSKRYICSFVKLNADGELKPNVVVIAAPNQLIARAKLCEKYKVKNISIDKNRLRLNAEEGIKTIRVSDTNVYVGGNFDDGFESDNSAIRG